MMPCSRLSCQRPAESTPINFLLNCISCANSWHHRCHSPPVSDKELIDIIKAFNEQKHNNSTARLTWQCGKCVKAKNAVNQNRPLIAVKKATPPHVAIPQKPIVIDDDDEIIVLDGPSRVLKPDETTKSQVSHAVPSTTQDVLSHRRHQSSTTSASEQLNMLHIRSQPRRTREISIIDDPYLVLDPISSKPSQTPSSSKPQVISESIDLTASGDEGGDGDVLEYLTPPPTPAPTSKQAVKIVEEVPLILTSNQAPPYPLPRDTRPTAQSSTMTTTPQLPNQLLTRWLDHRSTADGVTSDLWTRAYLCRDQDATKQRGLGGEQSPSISPPSRRKSKAHRLDERSLATVFLFAEGWLREKQATLSLE